MTHAEKIKAIDAEIKFQEAELKRLREERAAIAQEENQVDKIFDAVLNCPHSITAESVTLHFCQKQNKGYNDNALSQLRHRLAAYDHAARQREMQLLGEIEALERLALNALKQLGEEAAPQAQAAANTTDQSRAQFDAWIRTHEDEHGAVDEASAWAAWSACSLMQVTNTTMHGLEQFIEQVGDVHFQKCRVGSKEGAIRWDIEFGHYGDEVRGKTLREAITKAIAAQAKQGDTQP